MTLKTFQKQLSLDTLYKVNLDYHAAADQVQPNIFINSGTINIYAYNGATEPDYLNDMVLQSTSTNLSGLIPFSVIPTYIAITQNTGTSSEIISSGLEIVTVKNIGAST